MGALQTSKGARLPRIAASSVRSDSSFNKRKTPRTTRRSPRGSQPPGDHTMSHKRSRRLLHQNADDLRPEDSRSRRQPDAPKPHATPHHRDHTSTVAAESNWIKFNVCRHRGRTLDFPLLKLRKPCFDARLSSPTATGILAIANQGGHGRSAFRHRLQAQY